MASQCLPASLAILAAARYMGPPMKVTVNGEARDLPDGTTVTQLLTSLEVSVGRVAVEVNTAVVRRARHDAHVLAEGDHVEIVTFVGGG